MVNVSNLINILFNIKPFFCVHISRFALISLIFQPWRSDSRGHNHVLKDLEVIRVNKM